MKRKTKISKNIKRKINKKDTKKESKIINSIVSKLSTGKKSDLTKIEIDLLNRLKIAEYILKVSTLKNTGKPLKLEINFLSLDK